MLEIYFDENVPPRIARALAVLHDGEASISVHATVDVTALGKGATDQEVTEYLAKRSAVIITQDRDYRQQRAIIELCKKYKIGVFLLHHPKHQAAYWNTVQLIVNNWEKILDVVQDKQRPYWYKITPRSFGQLR